MNLRRHAALLAVAALALVAGCDQASGGSPDPTASSTSTSPSSSAPTGSTLPTYVALGDSYTAAPGVPQTEQESGCLRSSGNYPNLVATALDLRLVDVSCSGATTLALVGAQQTGDRVTPSQFSALTPETALVTLGIGGNDLELFQTLIGTCSQLSYDDPDGSPCRDLMQTGGTDQDLLVAKIDKIGARVASALKGIRDRAPQATVVLVGYPQAVPPSGTCEILPLAEGDYGYVRSITEDLNEAMREAASRGKATYIDLLEVSAGHDICAGADAWVNGFETDVTRALAFHPFAEGQQAVADLIVAKLEKQY